MLQRCAKSRIHERPICSSCSNSGFSVALVGLLLTIAPFGLPRGILILRSA